MGLDFIRVDWEVGWGVVDMMLSSIAPEVTVISQHCQKGVMGCNSHHIFLHNEKCCHNNDINE